MVFTCVFVFFLIFYRFCEHLIPKTYHRMHFCIVCIEHLLHASSTLLLLRLYLCIPHCCSLDLGPMPDAQSSSYDMIGESLTPASFDIGPMPDAHSSSHDLLRTSLTAASFGINLCPMPHAHSSTEDMIFILRLNCESFTHCCMVCVHPLPHASRTLLLLRLYLCIPHCCIVCVPPWPRALCTLLLLRLHLCIPHCCIV